MPGSYARRLPTTSLNRAEQVAAGAVKVVVSGIHVVVVDPVVSGGYDDNVAMIETRNNKIPLDALVICAATRRKP